MFWSAKEMKPQVDVLLVSSTFYSSRLFQGFVQIDDFVSAYSTLDATPLQDLAIFVGLQVFL